jgi:hypothetical protein
MPSLASVADGGTMSNEVACECWPTPEHMHYVYYGATEPGSAWEWNPNCPAHPPHREASE